MHWPLYVALAALALGAALAGLRESAAVPWFMVAVGLVASVFGLGAGLAALGLASLLLFFQGAMNPSSLAALLLAALLAHQVGESLRRAHRRAKYLAQTHRLLAEALEALPKAQNREELLKSLPERLARLGERGHVGVWVPEGQGLRLLAARPPLSVETIPYGGVVGRAYREGRPVYVPDVRRDPDYIAPPDHKALAELALPLRERGEVVAVLNLERDRPFPEELQEGLKRFAQAVSLQLSRLADEEERRLVAELSLALQSASRLEEAAAKALALLVRALGLEAGAFWEVRGARMVNLAAHGVEEPALRKVLEEGLPYGVGLAWRVYETRSPLFTARYAEEDRTVPALKALDWRTFAALPVPTRGRPGRGGFLWWARGRKGFGGEARWTSSSSLAVPWASVWNASRKRPGTRRSTGSSWSFWKNPRRSSTRRSWKRPSARSRERRREASWSGKTGPTATRRPLATTWRA